jgi:hypothetical protein
VAVAVAAAMAGGRSFLIPGSESEEEQQEEEEGKRKTGLMLSQDQGYEKGRKLSLQMNCCNPRKRPSWSFI